MGIQGVVHRRGVQTCSLWNRFQHCGKNVDTACKYQLKVSNKDIRTMPAYLFIVTFICSFIQCYSLTLLECGEISKITSDSSKSITSPGFPIDNYKSNTLCSWFYYADNEFDVTIKVQEMSIINCSTDRLEIYRGTDNPPSYTTCRRLTGTIRFNSVHKLLIVFKSGNGPVALGFKGLLKFTQRPSTTVATVPSAVPNTIILSSTSTPIFNGTSRQTTIISEGQLIRPQILITYFMPMFPFYAPRKQKTRGSPFQWVRKIFRKTNISHLEIVTSTCTYQGLRNVSFSKNFAYILSR